MYYIDSKILMKKSNKVNKLFKKEIKKTKKVNQRNDKTVKNKVALKKCNDFCKKDYTPEMNKVFKRAAKEYGDPYRPPTKDENEYLYQSCNKLFCNERCDGFDFKEDKQRRDFYKKITDGFQKAYTLEKRNKLKERGAFSGCVDVPDYDVFHT